MGNKLKKLYKLFLCFQFRACTAFFSAQFSTFFSHPSRGHFQNFFLCLFSHIFYIFFYVIWIFKIISSKAKRIEFFVWLIFVRTWNGVLLPSRCRVEISVFVIQRYKCSECFLPTFGADFLRYKDQSSLVVATYALSGVVMTLTFKVESRGRS